MQKACDSLYLQLFLEPKNPDVVAFKHHPSGSLKYKLSLHNVNYCILYEAPYVTILVRESLISRIWIIMKEFEFTLPKCICQGTMYVRLTTARHCLRARLTTRYLWTRIPLLRSNDPVMYVSPAFGITWSTSPTISKSCIWNIRVSDCWTSCVTNYHGILTSPSYNCFVRYTCFFGHFFSNTMNFK